MTIAFTVQGIPKAQPRPRAFARAMGGGKFAARVYDAGTAEGWKSLVALAAKPHLPDAPIAVPLDVKLAFWMPRPKAHFRKNGDLRDDAPAFPNKKPDLDNYAKAVLDALTQVGMWQDDCQIVSLTIIKRYCTDAPGASVTIDRIEASGVTLRDNQLRA